MSRTRWVLVPIAGLSLAAGVAVAGPQSSETTPFTADFQAGVVKQKQRACDASHTAFRVLFKGTETSSDPRLAGDLTVKGANHFSVMDAMASEKGALYQGTRKLMKLDK